MTVQDGAKKRGRARLRVLTRKRAPEPGVCLLVVDGRPCPRPVVSRGLCNAHVISVRAAGRLDELGLPPVRDKRYRIELKPDPEPGICRVIVNGEPCRAAGNRRGLCRRHYAGIFQRPDLSLDDFCLPAFPKTDIRLRRQIDEDECRVCEDGVDCTRPPHARGVCHKHNHLRDSRPEVFARVAEKSRSAIRYSLRARPREGRCRAAEDGVGCPQPARTRGLCPHHYHVLCGRPELLEEVALPGRTFVKHAYERADDPLPLRCVVVEDGVRCASAPRHRGVCAQHRRILSCHAEYSVEDFFLPEPEVPLSAKAPEEAEDGLCRAVEGERPCDRVPKLRGLCKRHHRLALERGQLETLGSAPQKGGPGRRFGAGNDRPHLYLDKNVLFDHADHAIFGAAGQEPSVAIVERVMAGEARGTVSVDAVKCTYNHVRFRLVRARQEGGAGLPAEEAERKARAHIERTFLERGAWRLLGLDAAALRTAVADGQGPLSLEDALELTTYRRARSARSGPTLFVTRDADFAEGVHPAAVARELLWWRPPGNLL